MTVRTFEDFSGGMDTRNGLMQDDARRFLLLQNMIVTPGRKIDSRPPLGQLGGLIDTAKTKGFVRLDGAWYCFAPKGTTPSHTLEGGITTLFFDLPDYCTADGWTLVYAALYGITPYAIIRHAYPGGTVTSLLKLHVWDKRKNKPTYCEDPACPTNWSKELPQHIYGIGDVGQFSDYDPVIATASNKLHMSRPDCNVGLCKTNDARVWNSRSVDQVLTQGDVYYFIQPSTLDGVCSFVVSLPWEDLGAEGRYAAYVFELLLPDGTWTGLQEVGQAPLDHNTYWPAPITSRFDATKNEIQIQAKLSNSPGRILRFRAIAKAAPITIITGGLFDPGLASIAPAINDSQIQWEGSTISAPRQVITIPPGSAGKSFLVGIPLPGSGVPAIREITNPSQNPYNGWERYRIRIIARAIVAGFDLTGTVTVTATSNVVTGAGTLFTTQLVSGDHIVINGEQHIVDVISSDTSMTTTTPFAAAAAAVPFTRYRNTDGTYFISTLTGTSSINALSNSVVGVGTLFNEETLVGDSIVINGEERVITGIQDDLHLTVGDVFTTTISGALVLRRQTYNYASDIAAGNQWYVQKEVDATLYLAGLGLASFINTSFYDNTGKPPSLIAQVKNRLGVFFDSTFQLWQTDPDPTNYKYLAGVQVGTGRNTKAVAVKIMDDLFVPTDSGVRVFSATGLNYEGAQDQNLGEILDGTKLPPITAAAWWSYKNLYVAAGAQNGVLTVIAMTIIKSIRCNAWSVFTFQGVDSVDYLTSEGDRLYIHSGNKVFFLDGLSTDYIDITDPPDLPFERKGRWHFMHMGAPNANKAMQFMDLVQTGKATWRWFPSPLLPDQFIGPIILPKGPSWGRARIPLASLGSAIAFEFSSRDRTGYRLEILQVEFQPRKR